MTDSCESLRNFGMEISTLFTDLYQYKMAYANWKHGRKDSKAVFDVFYRKCPYNSHIVVFAGLSRILNFLSTVSFTESDIEFLKKSLPSVEDDAFFDYLLHADFKSIELWSVEEGCVVFPFCPMIRMEGPLPLLQILETPILNFVNFASLITTLAVHYRAAVGHKTKLMEFGVRRAQGPDGAMSASLYSYMGGFDSTSNILAAQRHGIPCSGTVAHSFVSSYFESTDVASHIPPKSDKNHRSFSRNDLYESAKNHLIELKHKLEVFKYSTLLKELYAFVDFAFAFPRDFLMIIDTYSVVRSGLPNFCAVAMALNDFGYKAVGVRLDSGDLGFFSLHCRKAFNDISEIFNIPWFGKMQIVASNDINLDILEKLETHGHSIDAFGIGTDLVTGGSSNSLGCVCKLVEIDGKPTTKLSEDPIKITIPFKKNVFRLFFPEGQAVADVVLKADEPAPKPNEQFLCRHPYLEFQLVKITPSVVQPLHHCYWKNGEICRKLPSLHEIREKIKKNLSVIRDDHKRRGNSTEYKVSVSTKLYKEFHDLLLSSVSVSCIGE